MHDKKVSSLGGTDETGQNTANSTRLRDAIHSMEVTSALAVKVTSKTPTHTPDGKPIPRNSPTS